MTFFRGIVARVRKLFVTHPEVIWSVLIFVLPVFALILLMAILTSYAPSLDHHLGELKELYLARIAIQQVPGATKLEVIAPSQGTRGTILSSEDPSAKVSPEIVISS